MTKKFQILQTVFACEGVFDNAGFMLSPAISIDSTSVIAPIAGIVIDYLGATIAFDIGAVFAIAIPVIVLVSQRRLKREIRND